jgi:Uncharacterized protein conserved in bacteria
MDRMLYLSTLYEMYKGLCTEKQRQYFEDYYYKNLSLSEIAENYDISRNAVHSQLKIVESRLEEIEDALKLTKKKEKILKLLKDKVSDDLVSKIEELI